eukprot:Pompholyxophrys_punicea_v1_NODE_242_length_2578_cov_11.424891.p3 type:complete len:105 gc:universal NODE_242_length_2578_cov_11.424891:1951-1637(-)
MEGSGNYVKVKSPIHEEEVQKELRSYVKANSTKKGEPNLTTKSFAQAIQSILPKFGFQDLKKISAETARRWLHRLGFTVRKHKKGVFIDGHDRSDVLVISLPAT